ncbi:MAG: ABC transporter ATP-binding protein, partial [Verrucomicrobiales bacterium]|nr:ABC transporter ATP-binding protein [Verrucomicrobiales bacterium]
ADGETVAGVGPSGCGKSTLLQILGALDRPSRGDVFFGGRPLSQIRDLAAFRAREIGFVFQSFHLIPTLTALENVQVPMLECGGTRESRRRRAEALLASVGLEARFEHRPSKLSGGERQRVAVARSLANGPKLLLADEPTGNLDSANASRILDVLLEAQRRHGTALVLVTHDASVAARMGRVVRMLDGRVVGEPGYEGRCP